MTPTSKLQRDNDPDALRNFRTPRFDLDSLYGRGPEDSPFMYQPDGCRLALGRTVEGEDDCPRFSPPGTEGADAPDARRALIGDPRNDENVIVSQLHLAFIKYHNAVVDELERSGTLTPGALFEEACRVVRWHYQWLVIHDFLERLVGEELVASLFRKNSYKVFASTKSSGQLRNAALWEPDLKFFRWRDQPYIPVEFSVAAYRFGHSQVRSTYKLNNQTAAVDIPIFAQTADEFGDLRGSRERPLAWQIAWERFFEVGDPAKLQLSRTIDTRLAAGLQTLPFPDMVCSSPIGYRPSTVAAHLCSLKRPELVASRLFRRRSAAKPAFGELLLFLYPLLTVSSAPTRRFASKGKPPAFS